MMPLMSLTSLLNIIRPPRPRMPEPGDDNVYVDPRGDEPQPGSGSGGYLVAKDGRTMPLRGVSLRADARGGIARVVLEQRFVNPYQEALHVTYLMPLPAEAAVSGYAFVLEGRRIVGEVDRKKKARQRFEQAILEGKTAGIVEQERSSLFTQELGNVPAGADVVAELTIDQKLIWKHEGAWEWRFPTAVGPRYVGAPGQVADAAKIAVAIAERGTPARLSLSLAIRDAMPNGVRPESPSHRLRSSTAGSCCGVSLATEDGARLDRDMVVRWPVAHGAVGTALDVGRPAGEHEAYGLLTLTPPEPSRQRATRRDLILLLDTSGSMDGDPLRQLKRTALALIDSLSDRDTLEMIEFSSSARRWHRGAKEATSSVRREARAWVQGLRAGGGTEMVRGMLEALAPLTERSQRQVVLLTDGYIGQERDVITQVMHKLPRGSCRVHVVGVGSSVNRTLTAGVARAGAGVELILAPGEDAERLVSGLLARTAAPLVTHVEVRGDALLANAPAYLPDLFAGSPALISLQLRASGGSLEVSGYTADGPWREHFTVPACGEGQGTVALAKLFARETVEDLELAHATTQTDHAAIDREIERLGLRYQISTRLTTWVAVSQDPTVDPSRPGRHEVVAHEVPQGTSVAGMGLRQATPGAPMASMSAPQGYAQQVYPAMMVGSYSTDPSSLTSGPSSNASAPRAAGYGGRAASSAPPPAGGYAPRQPGGAPPSSYTPVPSSSYSVQEDSDDAPAPASMRARPSSALPFGGPPAMPPAPPFGGPPPMSRAPSPAKPVETFGESPAWGDETTGERGADELVDLEEAEQSMRFDAAAARAFDAGVADGMPPDDDLATEGAPPEPMVELGRAAPAKTAMDRPRAEPLQAPAEAAKKEAREAAPEAPVLPRAPVGRRAAPTPPSAGAARPTPPPSLRAVLRHRNDGMLVLEIAVAGELPWSHGTTVMVRLAGGREVTARVLPATTAAGTYRTGQVVRLVIDMGAEQAQAQPIAVLVAGRLLPVVME